jgi:lysophospholipase L1-like esterase
MTAHDTSALRKLFFVLGVIVLVALVCAGYFFLSEAPWTSHFWEPSIRAFESQDRLAPPRPGAIVFTGSSSIARWHTLADDMSPLYVINRGFGGSQLSDVDWFASRIVLPYHPRAVVLYAGDNDLSRVFGKSPERVLRDFQSFVQIVHSGLPEAWIYFVSIKPSISRERVWPKMRTANQMIEAFAQSQERVEFIDISSAMLDPQGRPRSDLLESDGLHPNSKCYALWTSIIKPRLMQRFGP